MHKRDIEFEKAAMRGRSGRAGIFMACNIVIVRSLQEKAAAAQQQQAAAAAAVLYRETIPNKFTAWVIGLG